MLRARYWSHAGMDGSAFDCARADCMAHRAGTATARRTAGTHDARVDWNRSPGCRRPRSTTAPRGRLRARPAQAGRIDGYIGLRKGCAEPVLYSGQLHRLAAPRQALRQAMQRPNVVRVLGAPLDRTAQP